MVQKHLDTLVWPCIDSFVMESLIRLGLRWWHFLWGHGLAPPLPRRRASGVAKKKQSQPRAVCDALWQTCVFARFLCFLWCSVCIRFDLLLDSLNRRYILQAPVNIEQIKRSSWARPSKCCERCLLVKVIVMLKFTRFMPDDIAGFKVMMIFSWQGFWEQL